MRHRWHQNTYTYSSWRHRPTSLTLKFCISLLSYTTSGRALPMWSIADRNWRRCIMDACAVRLPCSGRATTRSQTRPTDHSGRTGRLATGVDRVVWSVAPVTSTSRWRHDCWHWWCWSLWRHVKTNTTARKTRSAVSQRLVFCIQFTQLKNVTFSLEVFL